jgi:hypothetical protein
MQARLVIAASNHGVTKDGGYSLVCRLLCDRISAI